MKRGSVAIVGAAESDIGSVAADMSVIDLMAQGTVRALADAGLTEDGVRADTKHPNGWRIEVDASTDLGDIPSYYPK